MAEPKEVGRVALRWSYSSIKQPPVDVERLKQKLDEIRNRDPEHMLSKLPPTRAPLVRVQPIVGGYKAYSKEHSAEALYKSPLASLADGVVYNRKLVRSFKSGANLLPLDQSGTKSPKNALTKRRASSTAAMDLNGSSQQTEIQTERLVSRRRKSLAKEAVIDFMAVYNQLPRLNRNL